MSHTITKQTLVILDTNIINIKKRINSFNVNDSIDSNSNTILHQAIIKKQLQIIKFLLTLKPDIKQKNAFDESCEDLACRYFVPEFFTYLQEYQQELLEDEKKQNEFLSRRLNDTVSQNKNLKRKYEELNDKYNDKVIQYTELVHSYDSLLNRNEVLEKQNNFYKQSDDSRKKRKT